MSHSPGEREKLRENEGKLKRGQRTNRSWGWKEDMFVKKRKAGEDHSETKDGRSRVKPGSRRLAARMVTD